MLELSIANLAPTPQSVSFIAILPSFMEADQARVNTTTKDKGASRSTRLQLGPEQGPAACRKACAVSATCAVWTMGAGDTVCHMANQTDALKLVEYYEEGSWGGVKGDWGQTRGGGIMARKPGSYYYSGTATLLPIQSTATGANTTATTTSIGVGDSITDLWDQFADAGHLNHLNSGVANNDIYNGSSPGSSHGRDGSAAPALNGGYGAATVSRVVGAGETAVLRIVLAWHHPHRHHFGPELGNLYAARYADADAVAVDTAHRLADGSLVRGVQEWHDTCLSASDMPLDWRDFLVNSMATLAKTGMWFADGSWRQFESFSDDDPDPVHIHLYRSIPYANFFPELSRNLIETAYAHYQNSTSGYIHENFPLGGQTALGRAMGDTSTAFVLDIYQLHINGGANRTWLARLWPNVKAAAQFQLDNAARFGLPTKLTCSYDWFALESHDAAAYNGFIHVAALRAAAALAKYLGGETPFVARAQHAAGIGSAALDELLWHGNKSEGSVSYYQAYWDNATAKGGGRAPVAQPPLLTDTLYGELWSRYLGLSPSSAGLSPLT